MPHVSVVLGTGSVCVFLMQSGLSHVAQFHEATNGQKSTHNLQQNFIHEMEEGEQPNTILFNLPFYRVIQNDVHDLFRK